MSEILTNMKDCIYRKCLNLKCVLYYVSFFDMKFISVFRLKNAFYKVTDQ